MLELASGLLAELPLGGWLFGDASVAAKGGDAPDESASVKTDSAGAGLS